MQFEIVMYHTILVVAIVALESCPSSKVVLGPFGSFGLDRYKTMGSSGHQIFATPEFQSKRKRHTTPFGAGCTEYQPAISFLGPFDEGNNLVANNI